MRRAHLGIALVLAAALAGCSDKHDAILNPNTKTGPSGALANPYLVMDALKTAYEARDTLGIKALYDEDYQGSSLDQTDPVPVALGFSKADEVAHVAKLKTSLASVTLNLSFNMTRLSDGADPPGWATIQDPITFLEVIDASAAYQADLAHTTMEFKFAPHTPAATITDTLWQIVRWTEIKTGP